MNHDVLNSTCSLLQNANLFDSNQGQIVNFHNILLYVHSCAIYSTRFPKSFCVFLNINCTNSSDTHRPLVQYMVICSWQVATLLCFSLRHRRHYYYHCLQTTLSAFPRHQAGSAVAAVCSLTVASPEVKQNCSKIIKQLKHLQWRVGLPDCCILNTGDFSNHVNICSYACQSANIQQQESRAIAGVLGLKFANIIHWHCRCRQPHCLSMPPFSLDATLVNIRIKLILSLSEHLHFCRW